jgi:hypothetical protein
MTETSTTTHEAAKDAEVLAGVLTEPKTDEKATPAAPPRRGRRTATVPAKAATGKAKTATTGKAPARRTAPAKSTTAAKSTSAAKGTKPAPAKAESNGTSARESNQTLAVELIDLVAGHFKGRNKADQEKIANWLKVLPTGGRAHERYWPKGFARPTTSDWRKPEA